MSSDENLVILPSPNLLFKESFQIWLKNLFINDLYRIQELGMRSHYLKHISSTIFFLFILYVIPRVKTDLKTYKKDIGNLQES